MKGESNDIYDDLDKANEENTLEEETILELIDKIGMESNIFNTMDWINNVYERIQDPTTELLSESLANLSYVYPRYIRKDFESKLTNIGLDEISNLEKQFQQIGGRIKELLPYERHFRMDSPLDMFLFEISNGWYPPPELLLMLAKCFNLYFLAEGKLSLEDVFFGKAVKRAGNFSMRKARSTNFIEFHYQVTREKQNLELSNKNFNLEEFTLSYLRISKEYEESCPIINVTEDNIESFIVAYYRWKKQNLNKQKTLIEIVEVRSNVISALIALGYMEQLSRDTVKKVFNSKFSDEEILRKALYFLTSNK
jgi:hypothetical protein